MKKLCITKTVYIALISMLCLGKLTAQTVRSSNCEPPTDMQASYTDSCKVLLSWSPTAKNAIANREKKLSVREIQNLEKGPDDWIKWCGTFSNTGIGYYLPPFTFSAGARFLPEDLAAMNVVNYDILTKVKIDIYQGTGCIFTLNIYQGGTSPTNPGICEYSQPLSLIDGTNEVLLTTPYIIDANRELWVTYQSQLNITAYPAGYDFGPRVVDKGDIFCTDGVWQTLNEYSNGIFNCNWNIEAFVISGGATVASAPTNFTAIPVGSTLACDLSWTNPTTTMSGSPLTGINHIVVKRDDVQIATLSPAIIGASMTYTDNAVPFSGLYSYSVYAVTDEGNGLPSSVNNIAIGDFCYINFEMWDDYGDGWEYASCDVNVNGTIYGTVSLLEGNYDNTSILAPSGDLALFWNSGPNDCECEFEVTDPDGGVIYHSPAKGSWPCGNPGVGMYGISGLFHTSTLSCGNPIGDVLYNIFCDDITVIENIAQTTYTYGGFDPKTAHTWTVKTVCEGGGVSEPAIATLERCEPVGIHEQAQTSFTIVPNPAANEITVRAEERFTQIEVSNFLGQTLLSQPHFGTEIKLNISNFTQGVYFVRIISENGTKVKKFVKQ